MSSIIFEIAIAIIFLFSDTEGMNFVAIGDWGTDSQSQQLVARLMSTWCQMNKCDFIVGTGDNFYPSGAVCPADPRFNTTWKNVYNLPAISNLVWYQSLGNHDSEFGNEVNQVLYSKTEPRWYQPYFWYDFEKVGEDGAVVHFVVLDTPALLSVDREPVHQLRWMNETLANAKADWTVVVGHMPPVMAGEHLGSLMAGIYADVLKILYRYKVDVFLSGHEHNMEHITNKNKHAIDFVISGAGGQLLYKRNPIADELLDNLGFKINYFGDHHGIVAMEITKELLKVRFVDSAMMVRYYFVRRKY